MLLVGYSQGCLKDNLEISVKSSDAPNFCPASPVLDIYPR